MRLFKKKAGRAEELRVPRHIAIIMDGNGRWAQKRGLPRTAGHSVGAETFRRIATYCKNIGLEYLTVYAFSTENWKRPPEEVASIMALLEKYLLEAIEKMEKEQIRLHIMGNLEPLSPKLRELAARATEISEKLKGFQVNLCLNYGGRDEIVRAVRKYAQDYKNGLVGDIDEESFGNYLYSAGIPDPDLIIRPSGELRLSNFLIWQSAYSELYFTDVLWPDFTEAELDRAIEAYSRRNRRFGGI